MSSDVKKCKFCIVEIDESMLEAYRCAKKHNWCYGICSNFEEKEDIFMGFYAVEDLKPGSGRAENVDFEDISGENQAAFERFLGLERAENDTNLSLNEYIFDPKNRSKVDDLVVEARKLKHNICDWDYDFLGKYRVESVEAERLRAVLDDYILLVGLLEKG